MGTLVAGRSELLLLRTIFKEWFCNVASCCFYKILTDSYLLYMDNLSFLVEATTISIYGRCFLLWGLGASFNTILLFSNLFSVISPDNLSPYQGSLFHLNDFFQSVWLLIGGTCLLFSDKLSPCRGIRAYLITLAVVTSNMKGMIDSSFYGRYFLLWEVLPFMVFPYKV